jgi:radical SAM protein with 4Fe4S-binding SPASM domain
MWRKPFIPMSALFELTLQCNMRCIHCGSSAGVRRTTELSTEEWIRITRELSDMKCRLVGLLGGEPFIRKDWYTISQTIKDYGMDLSIMSNGALINDKLLLELRKLDPYNVVLSIDGGTAETHDFIRQTSGSFEQCKQALSLLKNAGISTSVITTVNKKNLTELPLLRSLLINRGIAWQIQLAVPIGRFPRELLLSSEEFYAAALFIATTKQRYTTKELPITGAHCIGYNSTIVPPLTLLPIWTGCPAGITTVGIQSDGGIKGCLSLPDEFIEGNIRQRRVSELWNDPAVFSYNRRFKKDDLNNDCGLCKYGKTCRGGCLSVSTSITGKPHSDPYCLYLLEKNKICFG